MSIARALVLAALIAAPAVAQDSQEWFAKAVYSTIPDEQIHYYNKALEADPGNYQAMHNLAGVYYRKGLMRKAIGSYENLIRAGRAYYQTFYNLACCYARVGDNSHALKALKRAFQKGFKDAKLVERDEDLVDVRNDPEYARLANAYLRGAKGYKPRAIAAGGEGLFEAEVAAQPVKARKPKKARAKLARATEVAGVTDAKAGPSGSARAPRPLAKVEASAELGAAAVQTK